MLQPRIKLLPSKRLIGKKLSMSFANNKTHELWKSFMPRRAEIKNATSELLFSLQVYPNSFFAHFSPLAEFEKWAAVEVDAFLDVPEGCESFVLSEGLYAVFLHKGGPATAQKTFNAIFETWLPGSEYQLDDRPHFELLGEKYSNTSPDSEEEVWIPIKPK